VDRSPAWVRLGFRVGCSAVIGVLGAALFRFSPFGLAFGAGLGVAAGGVWDHLDAPCSKKRLVVAGLLGAAAIGAGALIGGVALGAGLGIGAEIGISLFR
jgi:hypothetical protein